MRRLSLYTGFPLVRALKKTPLPASLEEPEGTQISV